MNFSKRENFHDTLSENEEELKEKFEKMEVTEEENEEMKS